MDMQTTGDVPRGNLHDDYYDEYLRRIQKRFEINVTLTAGVRPLFTTDARGLFESYLAGMAESERQYHTCNACRRFIERYGGLVTINGDGMQSSALWSHTDAPPVYARSITNMRTIVQKSKVTGVFLSSDAVWGQPETGIWKHFAIVPPRGYLYTGVTKTARQMMAEKKEDYLNVVSALTEFPIPLVRQALQLLSANVLYRSEKVLGQAQWLLRLHVACDVAKRQPYRTNVIWEFVATAPAGFCHPKSSMIGSLLEDLASGMDFSDVSDRWAKKMAPTNYQRPQTAPAAGTIKQAEKIFEQLNAAGSLNRRFARLDDLQTVWEPKLIPPQVNGGVFGHIRSKEDYETRRFGAVRTGLRIPELVMTWEKFSRSVLPTAEHILFYAYAGPSNYCTLLTAVDPTAPPLLQWDTPEKRNPVSWYVWNGGSTPQQFGLSPRAWHRVKAITLKPSMWHGGQTHQGEGVILVLEGAHDTREGGGIGLFPEILKSEFHGIRSVLEAYSKMATLGDAGGDPAAGLLLQKGTQWSNVIISVVSGGMVLDYKLDRWD